MSPPDISPVCPHCSTPLKKPPKRKARCKSCGEDIYVRGSQKLFESAYLTEEQAKATDWLRTLEDQGIGMPTYRSMETELQRKAGAAPPLEVIRAMLRHLIDRSGNRYALWQYARFKADIGEDAWEAQRAAFRGEAREYVENEYVSTIKIVADTCCEVCYPFHDRQYTPEQLAAEPVVPPKGCLRYAEGADGLCRCRYVPEHDFGRQVEEVVARVPVSASKSSSSGCLALLVLIPALLGATVLSACDSPTAPDPYFPLPDLNSYEGEWDYKATYLSPSDMIVIDGEANTQVRVAGYAAVFKGPATIGPFGSLRHDTIPSTGVILTRATAPLTTSAEETRACYYLSDGALVSCYDSSRPFPGTDDGYVRIEVRRAPREPVPVVILWFNLDGDNSNDGAATQVSPGLFASASGAMHPDTVGWYLRR